MSTCTMLRVLLLLRRSFMVVYYKLQQMSSPLSHFPFLSRRKVGFISSPLLPGHAQKHPAAIKRQEIRKSRSRVLALRWLRPVKSMAKRSQVRSLMCSTSNNNIIRL
ncbi:hypothetical protein HaLaN_24850, partial [Haematococcus lacustris]